MDLLSFKSLAEKHNSLAVAPIKKSRHMILTEIRSCFTKQESDLARSIVKSIIDDLGVRFRCENQPLEPYIHIALALREALIERGTLAHDQSDWSRAISLCVGYADGLASGLPLEQEFDSNERVCVLSAAILDLRARGYSIELPENGGFRLTSADGEKIAEKIDMLAASLGGALASSAAGAMRSAYGHITGRFNIGRDGQTVKVNARAQVPYAYLYHLGLRYYHLAPTASDPAAALDQLVKLTSSAVALLDTTVTTLDLMYARPVEMIDIMRKSIAFDSIFLLAQAKPAHVAEFLEWLMSQEELSNLTDPAGRKSQDVLAVARDLLNRSEQGVPENFTRVDPRDRYYLSTESFLKTQSIMREIFGHYGGANKSLTYPPKDTSIDAAFHPLLIVGQAFHMQPRPMAARATLNATLQWCRGTWKAKQKESFDDAVIGPLLERFVRHALVKRGVKVLEGDYDVAGRSSECDAVVETSASVIFFELKSKMLTRAARSGDYVAALVDLAQALVKPQAQAMERHAVLNEQGSLTLTRLDSATHIALKEREVLKISITRGDLGSLHDRPFLRNFLRAGCGSGFSAPTEKQQKKLKDLNALLEKLKDAAQRANEDYVSPRHAFSKNWSLSIFQMLLLLERTTGNESFGRELSRTRQVITSTRDFYKEYEFMIDLQNHKEKTGQPANT